MCDVVRFSLSCHPVVISMWLVLMDGLSFCNASDHTIPTLLISISSVASIVSKPNITAASC